MKPRYIAHISGKQPVPNGEVVRVEFKNGTNMTALSENIMWSDKWINNIIAYRVIEQE